MMENPLIFRQDNIRQDKTIFAELLLRDALILI